MFKYIVVIFAVIACAAAKPGLVTPFGYSAPLVAPGVVTATSSQVIARNYNGIATAPVLAADPFAARYISSPLAGSYVASPLGYNSAPFAYSAPLAAAPLGYPSAYGYSSAYSYAAPAQYLL